MDLDPKQWNYLPYPVLLEIFEYLNYKDLVFAGGVCSNWYELSRSDYLWRKLFRNHFKINHNVLIKSGATWYSEFKRLCFKTPIVQTENLNAHDNQVLHVSFSHNGKYFATCSKDGYVLLWNTNYPASVKYSRNMKEFSWKYTQYSEFNESDTLLLVSGVHFGTTHSTSGEIAVFDLLDGLELKCRVVNKPYDIFGTWYDDQHLLSGDLHWLAHLVSASFLWMNKASQEVNSEHVPVTYNMFRFYNKNASSIRSIIIANCLSNIEDTKENDEIEHCNGDLYEANGVLSQCENSINLQSSYLNCSRNYFDFTNESLDPIWYNSDYRKVESELNDCKISDTERNVRSKSDTLENQLNKSDKLLIFTTGFETYTPHQIGFKRIKPFVFPKKIDLGLTLKERLDLRERRRELEKNGLSPPEPNWLDFESVADKFDKADQLIDLHGHVVGMSLSPDHRYLYVNSRSWPQGCLIDNPLEPPPIAQEIDIHVIDLVTLKQVGSMLRAHKAYTSSSDCFFIFLDVCDDYVASGAEDNHGYLWDRHYGVCLSKFPHTDVVNSVAFNPQDSEMLITASDDHTIKIWRSISKVRELGLNESYFTKGVEFRNIRQKRN